MTRAAIPQPEFVPSWFVLIAGIVATLACAYAHLLDVRRERPSDWDAYRWRLWIARQESAERWRSMLRRAVLILRIRRLTRRLFPTPN